MSTLAVRSDLVAAGGFNGELVLKRLGQPGVAFSGRVTTSDNGITNAIEIFEVGAALARLNIRCLSAHALDSCKQPGQTRQRGSCIMQSLAAVDIAGACDAPRVFSAGPRSQGTQRGSKR